MSDGQVVYEIRGDSSKFDNDLNTAESKARKRSAVWGKIGKAATAAFTASTAAVIAFGKASVDAGKEFDAAMAQVAATMGITVDQCGDLRQAALEAGAATVFTSKQAADALNYMALAGYDSATAIAMLPNVLSLAAAGSIDLAYASDMITDSQTALGLTLEDTKVLVDQMAKAASRSNTSVEQLGEAILTVGGTARYMSGGTEELTTVLGVLADNGIKGSEAGTHLRNMLLSLSAPTADAKKMLKKLGVEIFDASGNMRSFSDIFPELNAAMANFTDQQKLDAFSKLFNARDIASATALLGTSVERWEELGAEILDCSGAAEQMAATQLDNLEGDIEYFSSALEGVQIRISDYLTPTLREFVQFGTQSLDELTTAFEEGGFSGALSALGGVLSEAILYIADYAPQILEAGATLLGALAEGLITNLPVMLDTALQTILALAEGLIQSLPELIPSVIEILLQLVTSLIENLDVIIGAAGELVMALAEGLIRSVPILLAKIPEIILKLVGALLSRAFELAQAGFELMSSLKDSFGKVDWLQVGKDILNGLWSGVQSGWNWLTNKVGSLARSLYDSAKKALGIASPSKKFREIGRFTTEGMALGIEDEQPEAERATREMALSVLKTADITASVGIDSSAAYGALSDLVGLSAGITLGTAPIVIYSVLTGSIDVDGFRLATIMLQNIDDAAAYTLKG